jgi:hypothetical protein
VGYPAPRAAAWSAAWSAAGSAVWSAEQDKFEKWLLNRIAEKVEIKYEKT